MTQTKLTNFRWRDLESQSEGAYPDMQDSNNAMWLMKASRDLDSRIEELLTDITAHRRETQESQEASLASQ